MSTPSTLVRSNRINKPQAPLYVKLWLHRIQIDNVTASEFQSGPFTPAYNHPNDSVFCYHIAPLFFSLLTNPSYPFFDGNQEVVRATLKNILVDRKQALLSCLRISLASSSLDSGVTHLHDPAGRFRTILIGYRTLSAR